MLTNIAFGPQELCTVQCSSFALNVERRNDLQIKDPSRAERVHSAPKVSLECLQQTLAVTLPHSMWRTLWSGRTSRMFSSEYFRQQKREILYQTGQRSLRTDSQRSGSPICQIPREVHTSLHCFTVLTLDRAAFLWMTCVFAKLGFQWLFGPNYFVNGAVRHSCGPGDTMVILLRYQGLYEGRKFGTICPRGLLHGHITSPRFLFSLLVLCYQFMPILHSVCDNIFVDSFHGELSSIRSGVPSSVPGK